MTFFIISWQGLGGPKAHHANNEQTRSKETLTEMGAGL